MIYYLNSDLIRSVIFKFHRVVHSQFWQLLRKKSVFFFREANCIQIKKYHTFRFLPSEHKICCVTSLSFTRMFKRLSNCFLGRGCTRRCDFPIGTPCQQRTGTCHTPRSSPIATRLMVTCTPTYIKTTTSTSNT